MRGVSRNNKFLAKITNINEDCSGTDSDENESTDIDNVCESSDTDDVYESSDVDNVNESSDCDDANELSEDEDENFNNFRKRGSKVPISSYSEEENEETDQECEVSMDGTVWRKLQEGGLPGRAPSHHIFKDNFGPTAYAKRNIMLDNIRSSFSLIIDERIIEHIRTCTVAEAHRVWNKNWTLTVAELYAFLAILYARGAYEAKNLKLSYLWSKKWGPEFFSKTMNRNKFTEILRFIRFDKKSERSQRLRTDKFALISEVWNTFITNSQNCYKPGANLTVDEQLFPSKARCRFTQYMPNKPDKFGIKFWLASDVKTKYVVNGFPYLGKDETKSKSTLLSEFIVLKLVEPYIGCGRTITTDNFFTSLSLAKKLLSKKTTLVGTIKSNKRELPKTAKLQKDKMARFATLLYQSEDFVLTIYKSKPKKKVLILSSRHKYVKINKHGKLLPETVEYYNNHKYGVDITDQMARKYTVKSGSRRWPLHVFYNILDLAAINAWILYKESTGKRMSRKNFLFQLAEELAKDYQEERTINRMSTSTTQNSKKRKWCQIGGCSNNKTNNTCDKCKKYVCGKCTYKKVCTSICTNCVDE